MNYTMLGASVGKFLGNPINAHINIIPYEKGEAEVIALGGKDCELVGLFWAVQFSVYYTYDFLFNTTSIGK